jgi:RHS repeat-associated protein
VCPAINRRLFPHEASGTTAYSRIDNDRMVSVSGQITSMTYEYDADGSRIKADDGTAAKWYLIDKQLPFGQVIAEYDNSGSLKCSYVYGEDRISMSRSGIMHYYLADGQGSVRQLSDAAGNVTDVWTYSAFGEIISRTGTTPNRFTYTGEQWDPNAGFYYLRARWYNPENGRFISTDPFVGDPQAALTLHRYLYANGSPASMTDPSGEMSIAGVMAVVAISYIIAVDISIIGPRFLMANDVIWGFHKHRLDRYIELSDIRYVVNLAFGYATPMQIFGGVGKNVNRDKRYIFSDRVGWIDLQHVVSAMAAPLFGQGFLLGAALEQVQAFTHPYSSFQPEDFLSNAIGTLASGVFGPDPGYDASVMIEFVGQPLLSHSQAEKELKEECGIR